MKLTAGLLLFNHSCNGTLAIYVDEFKAKDVPGAINLEWDGGQRMLTARAIAKMGNRPHKLMAIFDAYLLERHGRRLNSINLQLGVIHGDRCRFRWKRIGSGCRGG